MTVRLQRAGRRTAAALGAAACAAALVVLPQSAAAQPSATAPGPPVPSLRWHPCPAARDFQCATARVPLDYRHPFGRTIELAVIRHRATDPARRIGSVFFNPGGPGGRGVSGLPGVYPYFPAAVRQRFDIVSFDPRGVGQSTAVECFPSAGAAQRFFSALPQGFPVGAGQARRWVGAYAALGRACQRRDGYLLPHLSTADVARDMNLLRQAVGDPMLNYLGASYGTYLGATYANLFPGTVRAMVLDGVVAPTAWSRSRQVRGVPLGTFLRVGMDTGQKATLQQFLDLCGRAGPRRCAFAAGNARATRAKYVALLRRVRRRPVRVTLPGLGKATFTYGALVSHVAGGLYYVGALDPSTGWANLARLLQAAWRASGRQTRSAPAAPATSSEAAGAYLGQEQQTAIVCADSPNPRVPASYARQAAFGKARSGAFGDYVAWLTEACSTWPATDADGYFGPWNHWTAHPILLVGNTYDPATPYPGAVSAARELARARLLTLDGYGHTALLNPSACVNRYESAYFISGVLPAPGTVCQQSVKPFGPDSVRS